ncbi:orotidine-5'-phosphate decarboxylase [Marinibactrum halimedae]|uniref:Orotidine 5'-phosphate decarboxylase n=1 Tax=Marinibactrum halimedae TaxID=1444977 RepID=A0AA37TAS4_9GAMM|nr:orotidine-5'-phosphate decarboxylase [Marinibactrum halimedae]MCD9459826.1 orotidine-5'-phosphate decarboxylase [Marinibactrum halimedae]GLS26981.1 orotidine 5'-phosphate decarboxylase [Marinibactrum halimedae]
MTKQVTTTAVDLGPKLIVALDYPDANSALTMAKQLSPEFCRVKVGKELFTASGPHIVEQLQILGFDVFLDLKYHDIPNTCAGAVRAAANLGVWMVNVHAQGGRRMMEAAKNAIVSSNTNTLLIAVTVLTSMQQEDLSGLGIAINLDQYVATLAQLANECGLDGVVCSAFEASSMVNRFGSNFLRVTPGVRPSNSVKGDQRRVMTPAEAVNAGSSHIVVGRPITQADDPGEASAAVVAELSC